MLRARRLPAGQRASSWKYPLDPPGAAHFHGPADPGKNSGIVMPMQSRVASPIKVTATLTDAQAGDLLAGKWYSNIHTEATKRRNPRSSHEVTSGIEL